MSLTSHAQLSSLSITAGGVGSGRYPKGSGKPKVSESKLANRFRTQLALNWEKSKAEYKQKYGNVIAPDKVIELSPDYRRNRSNPYPYYKPGVEMLNEIYQEGLKKPADENHRNTVLFTAGAPGAGKTTSLGANPEAQSLAKEAQIVRDNTMSDPEEERANIDAALAAGKNVTIAYVHRDHLDAFAGVLKRAEEEGRVVTAADAAGKYVEIRDALKQIRDRYKTDPRVAFVTIDNSRGFGKAAVTDFESLPAGPKDKIGLTKQLQDMTQKQYDEGKLSKKNYHATMR